MKNRTVIKKMIVCCVSKRTIKSIKLDGMIEHDCLVVKETLF